jgi:hypothetical protein
MSKKMTMGVIVGNRGFFPDHLAKIGREAMIRAIESESGGLSTGGSMFMPVVGYDVTSPNIAILHFKMPAFLNKGEPVHWVIRSRDDQQVVIKSIRAVAL